MRFKYINDIKIKTEYARSLVKVLADEVVDVVVEVVEGSLNIPSTLDIVPLCGFPSSSKTLKNI